MGKPKDDKKNLDDLKKNLKTVKKDDMSKMRGGKGKNWNNGCGGIIPQ